MTVHHLDPEPGTTIDYFSRASAPVLTVDPGDTVVVRSLDASGYLERLQTPGEVRPTMFTEPRGHCLTGPIAVRGAEPGMVLALRLEFLQPQSWGWTVANARDNTLNRRLGLTDLPPSWLLWEIDAEAGTATDQSAHQVRTAPFLGVMGVAPAEFGEHSTIPPRAIGGGNIDCRASSRVRPCTCRSTRPEHCCRWGTATPGRETAKYAEPPSNAR